MSGFIYLWFDRRYTRYYIGSHWGTQTDGYVCSSNSMREAHRRRPEDFKRRILCEISTSRQDLRDEEQRWLDMIKDIELSQRYYNKRRMATRNPIGIKFPNRKRPSTPNYAKGKTNPKLKETWNSQSRQKYACPHCQKLFYNCHLILWHGDLCLSNPNIDTVQREIRINRQMMKARTGTANMKRSTKLSNRPQKKTSYCGRCDVWTAPHTHARYHDHELDD